MLVTGAGGTEYERFQQFNAIVHWLHSFRYNNIIGVFDEISRSLNGHTIKVVEIGCAHAKLFSILDERFNIDYTGIEIDDEFANIAKDRYGNRSNFRLIHGRAEEELKHLRRVDVVVALETLEHIPEHFVVRLVEEIAMIKPQKFVCSVPVEIGPAIWLKNVGSLLTGYVRHKEYTWPETFWAGVAKLDKIPPHATSHKGFDWRWLAQTIRHNLKIREIRKFPLRVLPACVSTSVFIIAEPR